jgi:hypothetical protein
MFATRKTTVDAVERDRNARSAEDEGYAAGAERPGP